MRLLLWVNDKIHVKYIEHYLTQITMQWMLAVVIFVLIIELFTLTSHLILTKPHEVGTITIHIWQEIIAFVFE